MDPRQHGQNTPVSTSPSTEAPPTKEVAELEQRADKISLDWMVQKAEFGDLPSGITLYRCADCGAIMNVLTVFAGYRIFSAADLKDLASRKASGPGEKCTCGRQMSIEERVANVVDIYFPEVDMHLQARLFVQDPAPKTGNFGFYKVDRTGVTRLGTEFDHDVMVRAFGRPVNARESWLSLLRKAEATGKAQSIQLGQGYVIIAIPPYNDELAMADDVDGLMELIPKGGSYFKEHLVNLDRKGYPFHEGTYHEWAGQYEAMIQQGSMSTVIGLDIEQVRSWLEWALSERKLRFQKDPGDDLIYSVQKGDYSEEMSMRILVLEGIHKARTLYEMTMTRAVEIEKCLEKIALYVEAVKKTFPQVQFTVKGNELAFKSEDGSNMGINLSTMPQKVSHEGKDFETHLNMVRGMLKGGSDSLEVCSCGMPAYISKVVKPIDWPPASSVPQEIAGTDKDPRTSMVQVRYIGFKVIFSTDCKDHSNFLSRDKLEKNHLKLEDIEARWQRDLDRQCFMVSAFYMRTSDDVVIAFVGHGASNLLTSPELLLGAFKAAGVHPQKGDVTVVSPHTDIIVVASAGVPDVYVQNLTKRAIELHVQDYGDRGQDIQVRTQMRLAGQPKGQFTIEQSREL